MKVVILCGGKGTRLREETEYRPKPMVPIGGYPIVWHIMKTYASFGYTDFVLCLGYKGDQIKQYFRDYLWQSSDVTLRLKKGEPEVFHNAEHGEQDWTVTLADTGEESMTAYRIREIKKYIPEGESFMLTYGDGLASIDVDALISYHKSRNSVCTLSGVHPPGRFGELAMTEEGFVQSFQEKPDFEGAYINGGYMVCTHEMFDYLPDDPSIMLERAPMESLAADGKLAVYKHDGFWRPMDTYSEWKQLNEMWQSGTAPWKRW